MVKTLMTWGDEVTDYEGRTRRIRLYWDNQAGVEPGWYAEVLGRYEEGDHWEHLTDSMKVGFPVDLDEYTEEQEDEVRAALLEEFPGAEWA